MLRWKVSFYEKSPRYFGSSLVDTVKKNTYILMVFKENNSKTVTKMTLEGCRESSCLHRRV